MLFRLDTEVLALRRSSHTYCPTWKNPEHHAYCYWTGLFVPKLPLIFGILVSMWLTSILKKNNFSYISTQIILFNHSTILYLKIHIINTSLKGLNHCILYFLSNNIYICISFDHIVFKNPYY